jgi:hypothetical protein
MKSPVFWDIIPYHLAKSTDVSEEHASIFRDEYYAMQKPA